MIMNTKLYNFLKWVSLVGLDAFGVFYGEIADIWSLPYGDAVLKTCVSASALIGTLIGISGVRYAKKDFEAEGLASLKAEMERDDYIGENFNEGGEDDE